MRAEFQADLAIVSGILVTMAEQVRAAMKRATSALLTADQTDAEEVLHGDVDIDLGYQAVEERVYELLARQAPVASDLRLLVTALHVAADLERMGDLAEHVAKVCLRRLPTVAVPEELVPVVRDMATLSDEMAGKIADSIRLSDAALAAELEHDDDQVDELNRQRADARHRLAARGRGEHRRRHAGPVVRAVRRPRGERRSPGRLPGHRRGAAEAERPGHAGRLNDSRRRPSPRPPQRSAGAGVRG
jgi:phosphate transport system protein